MRDHAGHYAYSMLMQQIYRIQLHLLNISIMILDNVDLNYVLRGRLSRLQKADLCLIVVSATFKKSSQSGFPSTSL